MIVPSARLLFWFAIVVLPFSALAAVYPPALLIAAALILGLIIVALWDATTASGRLGDLKLEAPDVLRVSKDRSATLPIILRTAKPVGLQLRFGLTVPRELNPSSDETELKLSGDSEASTFNWTFRPTRRGNFRLSRAYLETASRLGFWLVRRIAPVSGEIRVYPNLLTERRNLAALFLNRGSVGTHALRQVGKGRDFEKLREYVPGDGYDEIHWKATARRGHPVTKVFQIERTQEVYVVIDASRLSGRSLVSSSGFRVSGSDAGSAQLETRNSELETSESVLERFLTSALILGQAAERQGDLFGMITFADQVQTFLRAKNGKAHYAACRDAIYTLEAQNITPDFDEIGAFIRTRLRRRALLIFLTSLDDPVLAEGFVRNMSLLAGQHLVMVAMIKPPGVEPLFSNANVGGIDDLYAHLGGHLRWHGLRELEKTLQRRGVRLSLVEHERLAVDLVEQYAAVKQRQLI